MRTLLLPEITFLSSLLLICLFLSYKNTKAKRSEESSRLTSSRPHIMKACGRGAPCSYSAAQFKCHVFVIGLDKHVCSCWCNDSETSSVQLKCLSVTAYTLKLKANKLSSIIHFRAFLPNNESSVHPKCHPSSISHSRAGQFTSISKFHLRRFVLCLWHLQNKCIVIFTSRRRAQRLLLTFRIKECIYLHSCLSTWRQQWSRRWPLLSGVYVLWCWLSGAGRNEMFLTTWM